MIKLKSINDIKKTPYKSISNFDTLNFKFATLEWAKKNSNTEICQLLDSMPIEGNHRNTLVDVKIHHLEYNQWPALPHWHLDGTSNYFHKEKEEVNHLYITDSFCPTEFLSEPVLVDIKDENTNFDKLLKNCSGAKISANTIYTYGRVPHRATPSMGKCTRLLVRVTETNIIQPKNQVFKPTYWSQT